LTHFLREVQRVLRPGGHFLYADIMLRERLPERQRMLDQAGLKIARQGDVELSSRNPNFVVTGAKARSEDVLSLIDDLRKKVKDRTSVELELALDVW
jgi:UDP-N-acetylenolpyruvoylglucosamine reductase